MTSAQRGWSKNRFCWIPGLSGKSLPLGRLPFVVCKMRGNCSVLNVSESYSETQNVVFHCVCLGSVSCRAFWKTEAPENGVTAA